LAPIPRIYGLGVRNPSQDAYAIARGNAFVATADNPSAIYYNPAGITQLPGQQVRLGVLNYLGLVSEYEAPNGREAKTKYRIEPVPQLYYTFTQDGSPVSFGVGVYAPFGLGLEWPDDTGFLHRGTPFARDHQSHLRLASALNPFDRGGTYH
jgi:long-chain fatty acid transport protein